MSAGPCDPVQANSPWDTKTGQEDLGYIVRARFKTRWNQATGTIGPGLHYRPWHIECLTLDVNHDIRCQPRTLQAKHNFQDATRQQIQRAMLNHRPEAQPFAQINNGQYWIPNPEYIGRIRYHRSHEPSDLMYWDTPEGKHFLKKYISWSIYTSHTSQAIIDATQRITWMRIHARTIDDHPICPSWQQIMQQLQTEDMFMKVSQDGEEDRWTLEPTLHHEYMITRSDSD